MISESEPRKIRNDLYVEKLNSDMGYYFRAERKIFEKQTKYQYLEVFDLPRFGRALRLDGIFQTSYFDEVLYHEPLSHVAGMSMRGGAKNALVIGGGDGGMVEELLKYKTMERVVMVELDEDVVKASREYLPEISKGAFDDARLDLRFEDGVAYIQNTNEKFDQVILDLTDPFGPSVALYTQEFYQDVHDILTEKGCLSLHVESPITRPEAFARLIHTLKTVFPEVHPMFNYVPLYGTLWGFAVCSRTTNPTSISKAEIKDKLEGDKLPDLRFYNEDTHFSLLAIPNYVKDILAKGAKPYTRNDTVLLEEDLLDHPYVIFESNE